MKKKIIVLLLSILILSEIICITGLCFCKGQSKNISNITIREIPQQTVLYRIYRGRHYQIGEAIRELYALAKENNIATCGYVSTCYLNSPVSETGSHRIIEIEIPVDDSALELAGTLGSMTDIKRRPAMKVAVVQKPKGYNDPTKIIMDLFTWINQEGYIVKGRMRQSILDGSEGNYEKIMTEFMIPVSELNYKDFFTITMDPCYM